MTMRDLRNQLAKNLAAHQSGPLWLKQGKAHLDVQRLEQLVCLDLPRLTQHQLGEQFVGLADRHESTQAEESGSSSSSGFVNPELEQIAHFLMEVASRPRLTKYLPPPVLSEMYTFCGIIYELHHEYAMAEQSHLRALWVARKSSDYNKDQVKASEQQLEEIAKRPASQRSTKKI
jgi:hypothetical protein